MAEDAQEAYEQREKTDSLHSDSDMREYESADNAFILDQITAPQFQMFANRIQSRIDEVDEFTANNGSSDPHTNQAQPDPLYPMEDKEITK